MMKTLSDEELVELEIEGGSCWAGEWAAALDGYLLGSTFSGSDPVKFIDSFCNG